MCFSPEASFTAAALTATIGVVSLSQTRQLRDAPLAATPLLFAAQQAIEGGLWLSLPMTPDAPVASPLVFGYLAFAQVWWPVFAPLAVWVIEPQGGRKRLMAALFVIGALVAAYLLVHLIAIRPTASIINDHIVYATHQSHPIWIAAAYLSAVCAPLLLSSHRIIQALGVIVLIGCVVSYAFYWQAFQSVWCYFAGAASLILVGHFMVGARRESLSAV